jgi:methanogenic corrinoid protein MtbC1
MHQESRFAMHVHDFPGAQAQSLSMIAYRSRAVSTPTDAALRQLLQAAQSRNRAAGITGVLVHDGGSYFQWLEGPTESLQRLWASIMRDPRHDQVSVLREEPISDRVFRGWDLRLAIGAKVNIEATVAAMESSNAQLRRVVGRPQSFTDISLDDAFATLVIPRLLEVHGRDGNTHKPLTSTASIWHADADSGAKLAGVLISRRATETSQFVDTLLEQGANFHALCKEVFEPAQLQLGRLWDQDLCDDFHLTVGLARLQMEIRRVDAAIPAEHLHKPMHSVLLSAQSNEPHRAGLIMSSQIFERNGWDVMCNFPDTEQALGQLLQTHWFDVLKLSQSGALRRDNRLMSIRETIDSARAKSLNPSLIVLVDGRTFVERPRTYRAVHANAVCVSAVDSAPVAERLLATSRSVTPMCLESVS